MDRKISLTLLCLMMLLGMTLVCCSQPESNNEESSSSNKVNKLATSKLRATRSLGDMMEKVKNKIFGSRKQSAATAQNINSQRWNSDPMSAANSYQQASQYNPYSSLSSYQWPNQNGQSYLNQQYNPNMFMNSAASSYSPSASSLMGQGLDGGQQQLTAANPSSGSGGGLFSAASHLIAQYMAPSSASSSQSSSASSVSSPGQSSSLSSLMGNQQSNPMSQSGVGQVGSHQQSAANAANSMIPASQQSQYNDFAQLLDTMVANSGVRNSPSINQYLSGGSNSPSSLGQSMQSSGPSGLVGSQSVPYQTNGQGSSASMSGPSSSMMSANGGLDHDMSSSNTVQTYMPGPQQQQASASSQHKSPMVSLAENLAPGAQFNKLVSFPFSLTSNEDSTEKGKFKLHIPFMNQHVKRMSTDSTPNSSSGNSVQRQQQQQQQQLYNVAYLNNQHQQANNNNYNSNMLSSSGSQMSAQASQISPVNVAPSSSQLISPSSSSMLPSSASSSSSSSSLLQNSRPVWSTADLQASSSKLTPISSVVAPSSSSSSVSSSVSSASGSNPSST